METFIDNFDRADGSLGHDWTTLPVPDLDNALVVMPLPIEPLKKIREMWEFGENFDVLELTVALRDLFDGQDGYLARIDEAIGPRVQPKAEEPTLVTFTEEQVNSLVQQAYSDGFVAGMAGAKMRDNAKAVMRGEYDPRPTPENTEKGPHR